METPSQMLRSACSSSRNSIASTLEKEEEEEEELRRDVDDDNNHHHPPPSPPSSSFLPPPPNYAQKQKIRHIKETPDGFCLIPPPVLRATCPFPGGKPRCLTGEFLADILAGF